MSEVAEAIRVELERSGIGVVETPFPAELRTVDEVARALGMAPAQIVKAMLVTVEGSTVVVGIPGDRRLDLAGLRATLGASSVRLVPRGEIESVGGVRSGAVTPLLGLVRDDLEVLLDASLGAAGTVNVSSGDLSMGLALAAADLAAAVGADWIDLGAKGK